MKKIFLVVMEKDNEISLEQLREAGILHLEKKKVSSGNLSSLLNKRAKNIKALGILRKYSPKEESSRPDTGPESGVADRVMDMTAEKKLLQDQLALDTKEKRRIEAWGNFDRDSLSFLEQHGITLIPYKLSLKEYSSLDPAIKLIVLSKDKLAVRVVAVGGAIPGLSPFVFREQSLSMIDKHMEQIHLRIAEIENELTGLSVFIKALEDDNSRLLEETEFETARAGMENDENTSALSWLCGYIPCDRLDILKKAAAEHGWALLCEDPASGDSPPTLVKNNAVVRIIQPLFSFLGTVPGYREYDISFSYLVFMCFFFAMIYGDAGYGSLLFIISAVFAVIFKKKSGKVPDAAKLFLVLSSCTIVWGSITGSWLAIPAEKLPVFMQSLIIPPFNNSGPLAEFPLFLQKLFSLPAEVPMDDLKTRWNIQFLCFTIGAVQLIWARGKNVIKLLPSLTALAQGGWLIMMVGLYFLVLSMLLKMALPPFATWMIGGGLAAYFVFAEQNKGNFFKNIVKSFSNFLSIFLNAVGSFADIISYIRLFAVGLAGGIIAQSFNEMAIPQEGFGHFGLGFVLRLAAGILILAVGHALNIVMNALSVIVHGVRLNLLEYAGNHLGMEWTGYAYKPFALKQKKLE